MASEQNMNVRGNGVAGTARGAVRVWTIREMLAWCEGYLGKHDDPNPRLSAQWLVGHAAGLERIELFLDMERELTPSELDFLRDAVKRRGAGEPLQYLTGSAPFRFITLDVEPGVLIPRPETEVLVSTLLDMLPKPQRRVATDSRSQDEIEALLAARIQRDAELADEDNDAYETDECSDETAVEDACNDASNLEDRVLQVIEIGTGSGCIACALASERSDIQVTATDISPVAVDLARRNALKLDVVDRVSVIECDLGAGLAPESLGTFDALISNPPYIPTEVYNGLDSEVRDFEPRLALDGGLDGLDFYRRLLEFAARALKPGGALAVELHEDCMDQAAQLAEEAGFLDAKIIQDMAGKPRIVTARAPQ